VELLTLRKLLIPPGEVLLHVRDVMQSHFQFPVLILGTAMFNTFYFVGALVVSWVTYATLTIQNDNALGIPICLQCFAAGVVLMLALWIPESPRWLLAHDRHDVALTMLAKYHGNGDRNSPIVQLEIKEMAADTALKALISLVGLSTSVQ
jgi:hypothetical protein